MKPMYLKQIGGALLLLCLAYPATGHSQSTQTQDRWVDRAPSEWPHIAMINQIEYSDANHPVAGCAFLLDTGDEILAATAKHVLRYFKSKSMSSVSFRGALKTWRMFPKDTPSSVTVVEKLINENEEEPLDRIPAGKDWLLFTVREYPDNIQPLRLRSTPLQAGDKVFIIGWRYTDEGTQKIYTGSYVEKDDGSVLISTEALTDNTVPGLSGAPVIDANGYVVGLMSSKAGKMERLASVDYPRAILKERRLRGVEQRTPIVRPSVRRKMQGTKCTLEPSTCAQQMAEHFKERGWIGITPDINSDTGVISVVDVFSNSPAQKAGLQVGDIVIGFNGVRHRKTNNEAFMRVYSSFRPGDKVVFNIERGGEPLDIVVHLEPIPDAILAQWIDEHLLEFHQVETESE